MFSAWRKHHFHSHPLIAFPVAAGAFYAFTLSPDIGALSMSGSSAVVAINALLLKHQTCGH